MLPLLQSTMSAPPAAQPAPPPVDLITALQEQLARLNAMLFNYIGALQRDAPPQSLKGEALVAAPKTYDMPVSCEDSGRAGCPLTASCCTRLRSATRTRCLGAGASRPDGK